MNMRAVVPKLLTLNKGNYTYLVHGFFEKIQSMNQHRFIIIIDNCTLILKECQVYHLYFNQKHAAFFARDIFLTIDRYLHCKL